MQEMFTPWPEVRAAIKCSDEVWSRIRRLNPDHRGIEVGVMLRGYRRADQLARAWDLDVIGPKAFIEKYGREAYRSIPKEAFIRHGHRKAIKHSYVHRNLSPRR